MKYGDIDKVSIDVHRINDILSRQGNSLVIDTLAETVGRCAAKFKLNEQERVNLMNGLLAELREALSERL